ncbi:MAG: response regulator [Saprospiraceae bacterium]
MIRTILYEDNANYREVLLDAFEDSDDIYITAAFESAEKAVQQIREYQPDVVLMDIEMPYISGLDALRNIRAAGIDTKVLIQTQFYDEHRIFVALCRGANGYSLKADNIDAREQAIRDVHEFGGYFSPAVANKVISFFGDVIKYHPDPEYVQLTPKELEVLGYLKKHLKYREIAQHMSVGYEAVHAHVKNIYKKLHVNSKSAAVMKAVEARLV